MRSAAGRPWDGFIHLLSTGGRALPPLPAPSESSRSLLALALECSSAIASASLSMESRASSLAFISFIALPCSRKKPRTTANRLLALSYQPISNTPCRHGKKDVEGNREYGQRTS